VLAFADSVRRALISVAALVVLAALSGGGYHGWYHHRGPPDPIAARPLFRGITYERMVRTSPRPIAIHLVRIDLAARGVRPLVTPPEPSGEYRALKTSHFLEKFDLQVAINGGFFEPFFSNGPFDYYPHEGDPVRQIRDEAVLTTTTATIAIPGGPLLVQDGRVLDDFPVLRHPHEPEPRTAIALDRSGTSMLLVVVDGRQPSYSEGMTLGELASLIIELGYDDALNLDGGGSSVLVMDEGGSAEILSSPIHGRHPPGVERPVANHLGFFAEPQRPPEVIRPERAGRPASPTDAACAARDESCASPAPR
jgi:hypothetical protein